MSTNKNSRVGDKYEWRRGYLQHVLIALLFVFFTMTFGGPASSLAGQYCGAEGDWRNILIPDEWPPPETKKQFSSVLGNIKTVPIYKACMGHDDCYGTPGANRDECDRQFLEDMETECDRIYSGILEIHLREACHLAARGYYQAVKENGLEAFQEAQRKISPPVAAVSVQPAESGIKTGNANDDKTETGEMSAVSAPVFFNSDFENGDLTNWTATGEAFQYQPTKGDNLTARKKNQPSSHQGDFWVGTFEKYRGKPNEKPGSRQGDKPTGALYSIPFQITGSRIGFLLGGGMKISELTVTLVVEDREVHKATGNNSETMERIIWDVAEFQGKTAQIIIKDDSSKGWGHINADDFRFM